MLTCKKLSLRTLGICLCAVTAFSVSNQSLRGQSPEATASVVNHAHLVGHEDEKLLARIEDAIAGWDPRNLASPYLSISQTDQGKKYQLRRTDLGEFIADPDAAVALGKALFWEMRAGSDYDQAKAIGMACASCHYRFGADARNRNTEALAFEAWDKFAEDRQLPSPAADETPRVQRPPFAQRRLEFSPDGKTPISRSKFSSAPTDAESAPFQKTETNGLLQHEIVGSQGMIFRNFGGVVGGTEKHNLVTFTAPHERHDMFVRAAQGSPERTRQVTGRNSPSVINAVFNDRQFHDGRAESTFNGFSIFGDYDTRNVLKKSELNGKFTPVQVAIVQASLASQAVGPIVNEVEMSYFGRNFHDIAVKLLDAQPLETQKVSSKDSVLANYTSAPNPGLFDPLHPGHKLHYRQLIKRAFRKEWWDDQVVIRTQLQEQLKSLRGQFEQKVDASTHAALSNLKVGLKTILAKADEQFPAEISLLAIEKFESQWAGKTEDIPQEFFDLQSSCEAWEMVEQQILPLRTSPANYREHRIGIDRTLANTKGVNGLMAADDLMVNNFGLFWGLSIMLYESTLISNDSPFDQMLRGDDSGVQAVWNGKYGQTFIDVLDFAPNSNQQAVTPAQPNEPTVVPDDNTIRKIHSDKLVAPNQKPVLNATGMFQRGLRVFVTNCAECHAPPSFTSAGDIELIPELPEPIAKLHSHRLVRNALADAFKQRLIAEGQGVGAGKSRNDGVTDAVRNLLGNRPFFFDQERIPELEALVADLMIENMEIPDKRPTSFNSVGNPMPNRSPMITWVGTRQPLGFLPSPAKAPNNKPVPLHAFYDVGFYNLGVSEPRYDWGVWAYTELEDDLSVERLESTLKSMNLLGQVATLSDLDENAAADSQMQAQSITPKGIVQLRKKLTKLTDQEAPNQGKRTSASPSSSLGSAYQLQRKGQKLTQKEILSLVQKASVSSTADSSASKPDDHSAERNFTGTSDDLRKDHHFFMRARRMVMNEETWGHRKPFINDNELMGWGAFKTPSLRNIALTEPYMHNGRFLTLRQVLKFYGFDNLDLIPANVQLNPDLHPEIGRLLVNPDGQVFAPDGSIMPAPAIDIARIQDAEALLFFMHCLTDQRVRYEKAPFDHPSINIVNGFDDAGTDFVIRLDETGNEGRSEPPTQFPSDK